VTPSTTLPSAERARHGPGGRIARRARTVARVAPLSIVGAATAVGVAIVIDPRAAVFLVAAALVLAIAARGDETLARLYLGTVGILLAGYALLGRGFAGLGVAPLYVGEAVLALGVMAAVLSGGLGRALRSPVAWSILAFAAWGAVRTLPGVASHGVEALRDGVVWGYGAFAVATATALLRSGTWRDVPSFYARWLPAIVIALPAAFVASEIAERRWSEPTGALGALVPQLKPGDLAVHLAGAGAFLLLGLEAWAGRRRAAIEWASWLALLPALALAASQNRGGMVAALAAFAVVVLFRPAARWLKLVIPVILLAVVAVALDLRVDLGGRREVSAEQLAINAASVLGIEAGSERLAETVEWRKRWWADIVDYSVFGPYRWTGKGFGANLADWDGYQVEEDGSLRSPHNATMTILARMGVPGLGLWLAVQLAFAASLIAAYRRARRRGEERWARLDLWILAYWVAFLVNASFDVYLEGPLGGIWFWCLTGFGIAMLEVQRDETRAAGGDLP
jgi:hypothetical protein